MQIDKKIWFQDCCVKNGLIITDKQFEQLECYVGKLIEWNEKINLISRKDIENIWNYHILHCVSPLFKLEIRKDCSIVDIGTGGGLPGIPIKILRPDILFLCIDSTRKKAHAVSQIVEELKLERIQVLGGRAEEIGLQKEYFGKFDFAIARSVASLGELISWSKSFLRKISQAEPPIEQDSESLLNPNPPALLAFKGGDLLKEIEDAKRQHSNLKVRQVDLSFDGSDQFIASDKKILVVHF